MISESTNRAPVERTVAPALAWDDRQLDRLTRGFHRFTADIAALEARHPWLIERENGHG